jgi:magnesium chelatase family protein
MPLHAVGGAPLPLPTLDRIDLQIEVPAVPFRDLACTSPAESSAAVCARVEEARARQARRLVSSGRRTNAELTPAEIRCHCACPGEGERLLELAVTKLALSARAVHRVLKVARTIADLDASDRVAPRHLAEAIAYRTLDRGSG